jgi:hypothetical protein
MACFLGFAIAVGGLSMLAVGAQNTFVPGPFYDNIAGLEQGWIPPSDAIMTNSLPDGLTISTWFGSYPCIGCASGDQPQWCNGGLPQLANLTLHYELMKADLDLMKVPLNYSGVLVNDYESWHVGWEFTPEAYKNASRWLAAQQHPNASAADIETIAQTDYEAAAEEFFVRTLEFMQELRPQLTGLGFYGYPSTYAYWGNASVGAALNNRLGRLWNVTTAFTPSLYLPYMSNVDVPFQTNSQYIDMVLSEVDRVRRTVVTDAMVRARIKVLPYTWHRYHPGEPHAMEFLTSLDACLEFASIFAPPARIDGAILWGDETGNRTDVTSTKEWFQTHSRWFGTTQLPGALNCTAVISAFGQAPKYPGGGPRSAIEPVPRLRVPPFARCSL